MKILFIARHGPFDNQDEDAMTHALRVIGHEVTCVHEMRRHRPIEMQYGLRHIASKHDLCLFFKWPTVSEIIDVSGVVPCVYWHFDMIESVDGDVTLEARSHHRVRWCKDVYPYVIAGFHTDGDWVANGEERIGEVAGTKYIHLPQGADERRLYAPGTLGTNGAVSDILFTGMINHGQKRKSHIKHLEEKWDYGFQVYGDAGPGRRAHGYDLANMLQSAKVVIAPDGPGTDRYWSNRVVLTTALGGFILHPQCTGLHRYYQPGTDLHYYVSRDHLDDLIMYYLINDKARREMGYVGHQACKERNLYRHRCEELIRVVKERIK